MDIDGISSAELTPRMASDLEPAQTVSRQGLASIPDSIDSPQPAPKPFFLWRVASSVALVVMHVATLSLRLLRWAFHWVFGISNEAKRLYQELHTIAETGGPEQIQAFLREHSQDPSAIGYLFSEFSNMPRLYPYLPQISQGANICLQDDQGSFCRRLQSHPECYQRPSSHQYQGDSCYAIDHLLFWIDLEGNTRLQFENSPWRGFWNSMHHIFDFLRYQRDNEQQGVTGSSPHTEEFCIRIPF